MNHLSKHLSKYPNATILDIGTGLGNFIYTLLDNTSTYDKIIGIDLSERALVQAKQNFADNPKIEFQQMDALHLDFPNDSFDVVCLSNSMHHLVDLEAPIKEMERVLKKDGILIFNEMKSDELTVKQTGHKLLHHFAGEVDRILGQNHFETYPKNTIVQLLDTHSSLKRIDVFELPLEEEQEMSSDEKQQYIDTIDRLMNRLSSEEEKKLVLQSANIAKKHIQDHGLAGCTQVVVILQK